MTYKVDSAKQFACELAALCPSSFRDSWIMSDIYSDLHYADSDEEVKELLLRFVDRINRIQYEMRMFADDVNSDLNDWIKGE